VVSEAFFQWLSTQSGLSVSEVPDEWAAYLPATLSVRPASASALQELVQAASSAQVALYPVGGATQLDWGLPGTKLGVACVTTELRQVVDYPSRDLTITVQAGLTVGELAALLSSERQCLPVDVPQPDRATVGGAVVTNTSGPRRFGYGTFRDYLVGVTVVTMTGQTARAKGKVVKNVAGYDLCKLYTGSFGSLALVTELTFKLRPRPETSAWVTCSGESLELLEELLAGVLVSRTRPVAIELLNRPAAEQLFRSGLAPLHWNRWHLLVGFEGFEESVSFQVQTLLDEWSKHPGMSKASETRVGLESVPLWEALIGFQRPTGLATVKANFLSSASAGWLRLLEQCLAGRWATQVHAGNGVAWAHLLDESANETLVAQDIATMRQWATQQRGNLVVRQAPMALLPALGVWGQERSDLWLMRRIKEAFDPQWLLNPGRFVDHAQAVGMAASSAAGASTPGG
jgi:glycolate oxidase FAD binding subunit